MSKRLANKKSSAKRPTRERYVKNKATRKDAQLAEFARADLGKVIQESGGVVVRPQQPTSILLPGALVERLRARAEGLGIGYQTLLKMIVTKHIDDDL